MNAFELFVAETLIRLVAVLIAMAGLLMIAIHLYAIGASETSNSLLVLYLIVCGVAVLADGVWRGPRIVLSWLALTGGLMVAGLANYWPQELTWELFAPAVVTMALVAVGAFFHRLSN